MRRNLNFSPESQSAANKQSSSFQSPPRYSSTDSGSWQNNSRSSSFPPPETYSTAMEDIVLPQDPKKAAPLGPDNVCLFCMKKATDGTQDFCGSECLNAAQAKGPILLPIPREHHAFQRVIQRFYNGCSEGYEVCFVYRIVCSPVYSGEYRNHCTELNTRPIYPGANIRQYWSLDAPCGHWHAPTSQLRFCNQRNCQICALVMNHGPADQKWVINPDPGETFNINGFNIGILCDAAVGRVFRGTHAPPFYDTVGAVFNSQNGETFGWGATFSYILPSRGVLPSYLVWFK